jgi:hypothetical protein
MMSKRRMIRMSAMATSSRIRVIKVSVFFPSFNVYTSVISITG